MKTRKYLYLAFLFITLIIIFVYFNGYFQQSALEKIDVFKIVKNGYMARLRSLENQRLNENKRDHRGYSLLHLAAGEGHLGIVQYLIHIGFSPNIRSTGVPNIGITPLHLATLKGHKKMVTLLINSGANVNSYPQSGQYYKFTPLHLAVINGHSNIVRLLLENGADVNFELSRDIPEAPAFTALDYAHQLDQGEIIRILKNSGAYKNHNTKKLALHGAIYTGNIDKVRELIRNGDNINQRPDSGPMAGRAPLHVASEHGTMEITKLLIREGASIDQKTFNEETPLYLATRSGNKKIVELLIKEGADVNAQTHHSSALHSAAYGGHLGVVKLLVENGADVNFETPNGYDSLYYSVEGGNVNVSDYLIKHGADVNKKYGNGWSLLHEAARRSNVRMVDYLLEKGLSPTGKTEDEREWTPIELAEATNSPETIIEILKDAKVRK